MRWGRLAAAYVFMGVVAAVIGVIWRDGGPFALENPWLALGPVAKHAYSAAVGVAFGALVVMLTRLIVPRFGWAGRLHAQLRPLARSISTTGVVVLAVLTSLGEELLFRGLFLPWLGLIPQALLFGLAHQAPGTSRWVWVGWASLMGLALGLLFQLTGSLWGPILAHALINGLNLQYLKSHDPNPPRRPLGGLLGQRS